MKTLKKLLKYFICVLLVLSSCDQSEQKIPDYEYVLVKTKLELEAIINTRPAAGEMVSQDVGDPDPAGALGYLVTGYTDIQGYWDNSGIYKMYKNSKVKSTVTLLFYENDPDIVGSPSDQDMLDWETAALGATVDNTGTPCYTWNVNSLIDIKTKNYGVESGDCIAVWVNSAIVVRRSISETQSEPVSGITVRVKIYDDDGGNVRNYTLVTNGEGKTPEQYDRFNLSKGEYITFSAFLKDYPEVYDSDKLAYSTAVTNAETPQGGGSKTYTWNAVLQLYIK
jgi:hypothetical protein